MASMEINGNSVDPEEKPVFKVYNFNGKSLGQLKKDIPGYGRVYYKVKKVHELNEEKSELLCTCFAIRDKVWLPIQTAARLEQLNPLETGPIAKFFEEQIEANLNVDLVFSDDEENPLEEAEEPASSVENDVNELEIPSEITEKLEAIRKISVSPQKELEEEVLALNQCSSTDNGHIDQLEVFDDIEDAPGFSGGRHANRPPIPENSATAPEINGSPSEDHSLEEIVALKTHKFAEKEVDFEFLESSGKESPSDSVDRALGIAEKSSEVDEKGDYKKGKPMDTPSTGDSSSNSPSSSSKSDTEEDQKLDNVPSTSKSDEISENRLGIDVKHGEQESFLKPSESLSPRRSPRRGRTTSNASSRFSPEKKIVAEQEGLEKGEKEVSVEATEDISAKQGEAIEQASQQSDQSRRSSGRWRSASHSSSRSSPEKKIVGEQEVLEEEEVSQKTTEDVSAKLDEDAGEGSQNSDQNRRSTGRGRTASHSSSRSSPEKKIVGEQEVLEKEEVPEETVEDVNTKLDEDLEKASQQSDQSRRSTRSVHSLEKNEKEGETSQERKEKEEEVLVDEVQRAKGQELNKIDEKNVEMTVEMPGRRKRGRPSKSTLSSSKSGNSEDPKFDNVPCTSKSDEISESRLEFESRQGEDDSFLKPNESPRRPTRRGRTASNASSRSSPEKKIVAEQEGLEKEEAPEETVEDVNTKLDEDLEKASQQSDQSRRSTRSVHSFEKNEKEGETSQERKEKEDGTLVGQVQRAKGQELNKINEKNVEMTVEVPQPRKRGRPAKSSSLSSKSSIGEGQKLNYVPCTSKSDEMSESRLEFELRQDEDDSFLKPNESPRRPTRRGRTASNASSRSSPEKKIVAEQEVLEEDEVSQETAEDVSAKLDEDAGEGSQNSDQNRRSTGRGRTASLASSKSDHDKTLDVGSQASLSRVEVESQGLIANEIEMTVLAGKNGKEETKLATGKSSQKSDKSPTRRSTRSGRTDSLASSKSGQEQTLEAQKEGDEDQAEAQEHMEEKQIEEETLETQKEKIEGKIEDVSQSSQKSGEGLGKGCGRRGRPSIRSSSSPEKRPKDPQSLESEVQKSLEDKIDGIGETVEEAHQSSQKLNESVRKRGKKRRRTSVGASTSPETTPRDQQNLEREDRQSSEEKIHDFGENIEEAEQSSQKLNTSPRRKRTTSLASSKSGQQHMVQGRDESEVSQEMVVQEDVEHDQKPEEIEDASRERPLSGRGQVDPEIRERLRVSVLKKNEKEGETSQERKEKGEEVLVDEVQDAKGQDLNKIDEKNIEVAVEVPQPRKRGRPALKKKIVHESGYKSSPESKRSDDLVGRLRTPTILDATATSEPSGSQNQIIMTPPKKRGPGRPRRTPIVADLQTPRSSAISEDTKEKKTEIKLENSLNESLLSEEDGNRRSGRLRNKPERLVISMKIAAKSSPALISQSTAPPETPASETDAQPSPTWSTPSKRHGPGRPRKYLPGHEPYRITRPYIKKADRIKMEQEKDDRISRHSRRSKEEQEVS